MKSIKLGDEKVRIGAKVNTIYKIIHVICGIFHVIDRLFLDFLR